MVSIRLTVAQATVRFLAAQMTEVDGRQERLFEGVFAIFGHGNVAGLGEALPRRQGADARIVELTGNQRACFGF